MMFLLIRRGFSWKHGKCNFTFHDVSINTKHTFSNHLLYFNSLHSTMFLLIRYSSCFLFLVGTTLHSTMFLLIQRMLMYFGPGDISLHSTMFLLIPVVYSSLQYRYNLTTFCQSCHFIIFILIFIFLDSSHF